MRRSTVWKEGMASWSPCKEAGHRHNSMLVYMHPLENMHIRSCAGCLRVPPLLSASSALVVCITASASQSGPHLEHVLLGVVGSAVHGLQVGGQPHTHRPAAMPCGGLNKCPAHIPAAGWEFHTHHKRYTAVPIQRGVPSNQSRTPLTCRLCPHPDAPLGPP